jgi:hypothetical protein
VDLAPDFDEFCGLLLARDVEFVIVGAYALALHGAPRFTGDLDVFVRPTKSNAQRLLGAIAAFGFPTSALSAADIVSGTKWIEMRAIVCRPWRDPDSAGRRAASLAGPGPDVDPFGAPSGVVLAPSSVHA